MKKNLFMLTIVLIVFSCKKNDQKPETDHAQPVKRDIGIPITGRSAVTKTIGIDGGSVSADDGLLSVIIPAGALQEATNVSIQAIENTLPGSQGPAYRLLPEGTVFKKPVTIRISYAGINLEGTDPALLRLTYQDAEGYYYMPGVTDVDKVTKTVTTQSSHFSNWTVFECYKLTAPNSVLPGGTADLKIRTYIPIGPLAKNPDKVLGDYIETDDNDPILSSALWRLSGEGTITPYEKGCAYLAPSSVPNQNPVTVSVELTGNFFGSGSSKVQKLILLKPIAIEGSENFTINLDGVSTRVTQGVFFTMGDGLYISGKMQDRQFNIRISAKRTGSFPFKLQSAANAADISLVSQVDLLDYMCSFRTACDETEPTFIFSPGQVEISKYPAQPGEFLQGIVSGATLYTGGNYCSSPKTVKLNASFKILMR